MKASSKAFATLLLLGLTLSPAGARVRIWPFKGKEAASQPADTVKKKTPYDKLFEKGDSLSRGLLDVHFSKGKVWFEVPDSLLGRTFVLGSTLKSVSDNANGVAGSKDDLILFTLTKADSSILVRDVVFDCSPSDEADLPAALAASRPGGVRRKLKIAATSPSGASVVEVTDVFLSDDEQTRPLLDNSAYSSYKRSQQFKKDLSYIVGVKSFEDNLSVTSSMSYTFSLSDAQGNQLVKDRPYTAEVTRSIVLLPEEIYHPRRADPRIGYFFTRRSLMGSTTALSRDEWLVNRWRLEPSDTAAYRRGEKVEPVRPITYYIDSDFPEWWKPYIFDAVLQWNELFEEIGFKNAVRALPFPEDDPSFDPDNIRYSCIRYAPIGIQNAMGPSWVDPRSGEIINASVYVYHDVIKLLTDWMFVQTAQADPDVRTAKMPRELLGDALMYVIKHEVGHTLGLMHNMSGSHVIPTESLRDPAFTSVNGTTTSIMDYARFNYVAQPGDKERGVRLTPPRFGKYDRWAIRWGYTPIFDEPDFGKEAGITTRWLTDSLATAPFYRYGKQQIYSIFFDPRNQVEDLGDDVFASTAYGVSNLKYILSRFMDWIPDADDPDSEFRTEIYSTLLNQYLRYCTHVSNNIGGLYRNEVVAGDGVKRFENIPGATQRKAMETLFSMWQDCGWLDDPAVLGRLPIIGSPAYSVREAIIGLLLNVPLLAGMSDGISTREFSADEAYDLLFSQVWGPTVKGRKLSEEQRHFQRRFVEGLMRSAGFKNLSSASSLTEFSSPLTFEGEADLSLPGELRYNPVSGFEWLPRYVASVSDVTPATIYAQLRRARSAMASAKAGASSADKAHYELLIAQIDYSLK